MKEAVEYRELSRVRIIAREIFRSFRQQHSVLPDVYKRQALNSLIGQLGVEWDMLCAGGTITILPVCIMFFFAQKRLVSGLTAGAVKG